MPLQLALAIALHQLATVIWVGGMFFAHFALRHALADLDPPQRLPLMLGVLRRFFAWVWLAILVLWATGIWVFLGIYHGQMGLHVHAMTALALVMTALFVYLYFMPYPQLRQRVRAADWPAAASALSLIRRIILINLTLGLITAVLGSAGRYL